jgi:hypothetical protein
MITKIAIGLIAGIPALLYIMHKVFSDLIPAVIMLGAAALSAFIVPRVPGSPIACLHHGGHCTSHQVTLIFWLVILIPLLSAVAYKMARGDRRGVSGTRLP